MDWMNIYIPTVIRSPAYIGSSPAERGTWISVLAYACQIECGGVITGAATWKDRQWQQSCGVTMEEVLSADRLLLVSGPDVIVNGYPQDKERQVKQARGVGMAGAMKRWGKDNGDRHKTPNADRNTETHSGRHSDSHGGKMPTGMPTGIDNGMPTGNHHGMPTANAEGEGEGEGEGERAHGSTDVLPPPESPSAGIPGSGSRGRSSLRDEYQFFRNTPEYRNLKSAHCRVTSDTFLEWKSLIDDYGLNVVIEYAEKIPRADDRYPSRVQSRLTGADDEPASDVPRRYATPEWAAWQASGKIGPEPQMFA